MAVAARVVPDAPMAAVVTLLDMAAERGGAAQLDGRHHAVLGRVTNGSDPGSEGVAVLRFASFEPLLDHRPRCSRLVGMRQVLFPPVVRAVRDRLLTGRWRPGVPGIPQNE